MKIALIAKPISGRKDVEDQIASVERELRIRNIRCDIFKTAHHAHAIELAKNLDLKEYDAVVAMGGDGTNYHVLNGLIKYHPEEDLPPLGIIPIGRGNSFARDLQIESLQDGVNAVVGQKTVPVDVCRFTQEREPFYFVNLMGFGFVTDAAKTAAHFSRTSDFSYVIGVLHRTLWLTFHSMELTIDGIEYGGHNCFVEFCNSRYTGGDMLMAPEACINDGYFDVVILGPLSRWSLLTTFPKIFKGTHAENPAVRFIKAKSATVRTDPPKILLPDGEIFGTTPTHIEIEPGRVRYLKLNP